MCRNSVPPADRYPDVRNELLCTTEPHGAFDSLQGRWTGEREFDGRTQVATLHAGIALDGCSMLTLLQSGGISTLTTIAVFRLP